MARIQLYLISAFQTFGCRLGLLRIHTKYTRLCVLDERTILVECSQAYTDSQSGYQKAVRYIEDESNSVHMPHEWTSDPKSADAMVDLFELAYNMLLSLPLSDPLPLLPNIDQEDLDALFAENAITARTEGGSDLYRYLSWDRGQAALEDEDTSRRIFDREFGDTDWQWETDEAIEASIGTRTTASTETTTDPTDASGPPSTGHADSSDRSDTDGSHAESSSQASDPVSPKHASAPMKSHAHIGASQFDGMGPDPDRSTAVVSEPASPCRSGLPRSDTPAGASTGRRVFSGPPAGDTRTAEVHERILREQRSLEEAKSGLQLGLDKASFLELPAVKEDSRILPPIATALDRAESETQYEDAEKTPTIRDPEFDLQVELEALQHAGIRVLPVTPAQLGRLFARMNARLATDPARAAETPAQRQVLGINQHDDRQRSVLRHESRRSDPAIFLRQQRGLAVGY